MRCLARSFCVLFLCFLGVSAWAEDGPPTQGVSVRVYHLGERVSELPTLIEGQLPNLHERRATIDYSGAGDFGGRQNNFFVAVDALLRVDTPGAYTLRLICDDGGRLSINGEQLIDHDGVHPPTPMDGEITLAEGDHALALRMFQAGGGVSVRLEWKTPGSDRFELVPADVLLNTAGDALTTVGGNKQIVRRGIAAPRPGAGEPLDAPHPGFTIEQARPAGFEPSVGALAFLPDGKLALTTFIPKNNGVYRGEYNGSLYILDNITETDTTQITVREISNNLHDPLGLRWHDGALYLCDRHEIMKWTDTDGDGYPDRRESFASGWISDNYHHFTFGLPYHDGHFYLSLSTNITFSSMVKSDNIVGPIVAANGPNPPMRGCLLKIDAETGEVAIVSGGLRTPNGVSLGPGGTILIPDNQGAWKPASGIYVAQQGAFHGHYNSEAVSDFYPNGGAPAAFSDQPITPPAVWLPQNEISNSAGEMVQIPEGQPYAGQMLMAEITLGGLRRVFLEEVDGVWQGAAFRHSQGFEAGLNRLAWGPDGCLYVGGMGSSGNWGWQNKRFGLQRMRPTGETAFEFEKIEATADGFRVTFTKPVPKDALEDLSGWAINAWTYTHTENYGGPKIDRHRADPIAATASDDRLSVDLVVPDRKPNHVYHIRSDPTSDTGDTMWSPEAWVTFHNAPND